MPGWVFAAIVGTGLLVTPGIIRAVKSKETTAPAY
jgi:hypothetical protein